MEFKTDGTRIDNYRFGEEAVKKLQNEWKCFIKGIDDYPKEFHGKGIVLTAGGVRYATCAWIAINMIRSLGCTLPIELWHRGNELSKDFISEVEKLNVTCKNFLAVSNGSHLVGYGLKPLAIIKSRFKEILFIDADNNCVKDPTSLFDSKEFKRCGAIFWPDFWHTSKKNSIWKIIESKKFDIQEQESGQILIDKERCWKELNLCLHFNILRQYYYRILLGDKDTFRFAWLALDSPFYMIQTPAGSCGYCKDGRFHGNTMVQHDSCGEICFLHRNLLKWDITKDNEFVWEKIVRFLPDAIERKYYLKNPGLGQYYMDLSGDIEVLDFKELLGSYEQMCLSFLKTWRHSQLFKRFIEYSYFATRRYPGGEPFSLD